MKEMKWKALVFLCAFGIMGALEFGVRPAAFALSSIPSSGTCGMLSTQPVDTGDTPANGQTLVNFLATMTFSSSSGGTLNINPEFWANYQQNESVSTYSSGTSTSFSITAGSLTGSYVMSFKLPAPFGNTGLGGTTVNFLMVPVNSGNTILIQGTTYAFNAVCQF